MILRLLTLSALILCASQLSLASSQARPTRIAVLDFGDSHTGRQVADRLAQKLSFAVRTNSSPATGLQILDRDLSRAAALGAGYRGSLNMTLQEAQNLAATIGCDFFFAGDAQTLRRSPSAGPVYFESYAAIYLVSGRTGKLALWERPSVQRASAAEAELGLLLELAGEALIRRYRQNIQRSLEDERVARAETTSVGVPVLQLLSDDSSEINTEVKAPKPFRRLKPSYPDTAARAELEATVDVLVEIDAQGEVQKIEVSRWAGYGLDQSVVDTVRQLHFFPAMREGVAIPIRVLLRYNFRKPPRQISSP
jgi:TonB family protein